MSSFSHQRTFLSHIISPDHIHDQNHVSWLIGWNLDQFKCFVIGFIPQHHVSFGDLETLLNRAQDYDVFRKNKHLQALPPPIILGKWIPDIPRDYMPNSEHQSRGIWITLYRRRGGAGLHSVHSLGNQYDTAAYLLSYPLVHTTELQSISLSQYDADKAKIGSSSEQERLVGLINAHQDVVAALGHAQARFLLTCGPPLTEQCTQDIVSSEKLVSVTTQALTHMAVGWHAYLVVLRRFTTTTRPVLSYCLDRLTWRELHLSSSHNATLSVNSVKKVALENVSITAYQLHQKANQFLSALQSSIMLAISWDVDAKHRSKYWIATWSMLHFLILDLALGLTCSYLLVFYSDQICTMWSRGFHALFANVEWALESFRNSPGGVKLNPYITRKLGKFSQFFLSHWRDAWVQAAHPSQSVLLAVLASFGPLGGSVQLSIALDFLRVVMLPLTLFHSLFAVEFAFHCQLVYSLYLFFKSLKKNVLRQRYDTCEYDSDQLPFGTMLLSIMLFLLPSFATYYYFFAFAQVAMLMGIYLAFVAVETLKFLPYQSIVGRASCSSSMARIDAVEIQCVGLTTRGLDGSEIVDGVPSHVSTEYISPSSQRAKRASRGGVKVKKLADESAKRQLLEGLMEGLSPKGDREALCFQMEADETGRAVAADTLPTVGSLDGKERALTPLTVPLGSAELSDSDAQQSPVSPTIHDEAEASFLSFLSFGSSVHHRLHRKGSEDSAPPPAASGLELADQSSSPSASAGASVASQSVADLRDLQSSSAALLFPAADEVPWRSSAAFFTPHASRRATSTTTYMSYTPIALRLTRRYAACVAWLRCVWVEEAAFWKLLYRAGTLRLLRCKISKVARKHHLLLAWQAEQEMLETINYLASKSPRLDGSDQTTFDKEQALDEYKMAVSHSLPFKRAIQVALTGLLPSQQPQPNACAEFQDTHKARYCRLAVLGVLSVMSITLVCAVLSLVLLLGCLYFGPDSPQDWAQQSPLNATMDAIQTLGAHARLSP